MLNQAELAALMGQNGALMDKGYTVLVISFFGFLSLFSHALTFQDTLLYVSFS